MIGFSELGFKGYLVFGMPELGRAPATDIIFMEVTRFSVVNVLNRDFNDFLMDCVSTGFHSIHSIIKIKVQTISPPAPH